MLQAILNVFREDPEFAQHEAQYKAIARELLGDESEEGGEEGGEQLVKAVTQGVLAQTSNAAMDSHKRTCHAKLPDFGCMQR
jgi:hypothetical protein